jgi:hypothetical protein
LGLSAMKDVKIAENKTGKETAPIRDSWTPGRDEDRFFKDKVWDEDGWQITCKNLIKIIEDSYSSLGARQLRYMH